MQDLLDSRQEASDAKAKAAQLQGQLQVSEKELYKAAYQARFDQAHIHSIAHQAQLDQAHIARLEAELAAMTADCEAARLKIMQLVTEVNEANAAEW